jgi:hypothetical protein
MTMALPPPHQGLHKFSSFELLLSSAGLRVELPYLLAFVQYIDIALNKTRSLWQDLADCEGRSRSKTVEGDPVESVEI